MCSGEVGVAEPGHSCTPWGEGRGIILSELHHSQMNYPCSPLSTEGERDEVKKKTGSRRRDMGWREGGEKTELRNVREVSVGEWQRGRWKQSGEGSVTEECYSVMELCLVVWEV